MTDPLPVYLLLGPETGQKDDFINDLRKKILAATGEKPEEYKFFSFETRPSEIVSILRNGSLFSPYRLVIFAGIEELKKKDDTAIFIEYFAKPSNEATLILLSESIQIDGKLEKAAGPKAKKVFWELFDNQKTGWISGYFSKYGISIKPDASELLLEMIENDTQDLRKECEKLVLFFPKGSSIEAADIEKYIYNSKEENVFTLFENLAVLQLETSLDILRKILLSKDSNAVQLLSGLLWQWRKLLALKQLTDKNHPVDEAFLQADIKSKRQQKLYGQALKNFTLHELEHIIDLTAATDARIRSVRTDLHDHLLMMYLYGTIRKKGEKTALPVF